MTSQLPLSINLREDATLENFYSGSNQFLIDALIEFLDDEKSKSILIWGDENSGKTHLLQAACFKAQERNLSSVYLPLRDIGKLSEQCLEGLENLDLICFDDITNIVYSEKWQLALFDFINKLQSNNGKLLLSIDGDWKSLEFNDKNFNNFVSEATKYKINPMTDEDKIEALSLKANARGIEVNDRVAKFLIKHFSDASISEIFIALDKLDKASLAEQRKLTIPFVKEVLEI